MVREGSVSPTITTTTDNFTIDTANYFGTNVTPAIGPPKYSVSSAKLACVFCKVTTLGFVSSQFLLDGVKQRLLVCESCYNKRTRVYFCAACPDLYATNAKWAPWATAPATNVPCKKHSASKSVAKSECIACGIIDTGYHYNLRGQAYCTDCWYGGTNCAAFYCQNILNAKQKDVVHSGGNIYCEDCALVQGMPATHPPDFHPLSWKYNSECWCSCCFHLAGKHDRWPINTNKPVPNVTCAACLGSVHSDTVIELEDSEFVYCHACIWKLKMCVQCSTLRLDTQFHHAGLMASHKYFGACDLCLKDCSDMWLCEVSCKTFFGKGLKCNCGGVFPYDYVPDTLKFLIGSSQRAVNPDKVPFLGLELEIEAQEGHATRYKGAKIINKLAADYGYAMHDGTLKGTDDYGLGGEHGFEFVTFPFTYDWFDEHWPNIENMLTTLAAKGYRSWEGGRCGIHVHISRAPMSDAHQMKFIRFVYGSVNMMMCVGQRGYRDKSLQKNSPFHKEDREHFLQAKVRDNVNPGVHGHYAALNCNKPATLEARWFRGTLNPLGVRKNIEFMHSLWYFTKAFGFSSANEVNYVEWLRQSPQSKQYAVLLDFLEREYITRR